MRAGLLVVLGMGAALASVATSAAARDETQERRSSPRDAERVRVQLVKGALQRPALAPEDRRSLDRACRPSCRFVRGRLLAASEDGTLTLDLGREGVVTLPAGSVVRVQVGGGPRSRAAIAARNAAVGLFSGAAIGGLAGYAAGDDRCVAEAPLDCIVAFDRNDKATLGAFGLGVIGLVTGGLAGALSPGEDWQPAPELTGRPRVAVALMPLRENGLAVSLSLSF